MMTSHDIVIEDHSQDWWDRATKCFLNLQESVVQRSGQDRHPVRAGGERRRGWEEEDGKKRMGRPLTRHHPMNSTCTSSKETQVARTHKYQGDTMIIYLVCLLL